MDTTTNTLFALFSSARSFTSMPHVARLVSGAVLCAALAASGAAAAGPGGGSPPPYPPLDPMPAPGPDRTLGCRFVDESQLKSITLASGDVAGLINAAAVGNRLIILPANGDYPLTSTLYVAPNTVIKGDPAGVVNGQRPRIRAIVDLPSIIKLTAFVRLESLEVTGQGTDTMVGVDMTLSKAKGFQIVNSEIATVTSRGIDAYNATCIQVADSTIADVSGCAPQPVGDLVHFESVQFVDFNNVVLKYASNFGIYGRNVVDFKVTDLSLGGIDSSMSGCSARPRHPSGGIDIENIMPLSAQFDPPVEIWNGSMDVEGIGLFFQGTGIFAEFTGISTGLSGMDNAVIDVPYESSTNVCVDASNSSAPRTIYTCGNMQANCSGDPLLSAGACYPSPW